MKLSIFGRHPIPQGGFNGVMSLFEAIEFSRLGYDTELLLPFVDHQSFGEFLQKHQLSDLNELPRFGGNFSIKAVYPDGENFPDSDILVYQSYVADDWTRFADLCRQKSRLLTKNFPKFVASHELDKSVLSQLKTFDLLACALEEDFLILSSVRDLKTDYPGSFAYVPRGASPELLHPGYKVGLPPTIGFDAPNKPVIEPLQHYVGPIKRLRRDFPELKTLSIGRQVGELKSERVQYGRFDRIYDQFFNRIHLYCTINYAFSPDHTRAAVQSIAPGWANRAIYEVQNVEAQMSGAFLVGHRDNIISELYIPGSTGLNYTSFSDEAQIYLTLKNGLRSWMHLHSGIRAFAVERFSWRHSIRRWSDAIQEKRRLMGLE